METPSLEAVVGQALASAPSAKAEAKPEATKAPTDLAPERTSPPSRDPNTSSSTDADAPDASSKPGRSQDAEWTPFERELIQEMQDDERSEFEALPVAQQQQTLSWMKRRYRREARERTESDKLRKVFRLLSESGVKTEHLVELANQRRGNAPAPAAERPGAVKRGFQRALEKAKDAQEREEVLEAERTVRELVEELLEERIGQRVKPLEERWQAEERRQQEDRRRSLEKDINDLEDVEGFPASLVETYREDMRAVGLQHPTWSAWRLLHLVADEDVLRKAKAALKAPASAEQPPPARRPSPMAKAPPAKEGATSPRQLRQPRSLEKLITGIFQAAGRNV